MRKFEEITKKELGIGSSIQLEIVDTEEDIYYHMAFDMLDHIIENKKQQKHTVFIVPVGPLGQYKKLADICNNKQISLKDVWFINMDEYMADENNTIPQDHPLSFEGFMYQMFYNRLEEHLNIPVEQRVFPKPGHENEIWDLIERLGGVDVAYGGIGINGHVAFNEPPEPGISISNDEFKRLPTRVMDLSRETRAINSITAANGYIDYIPEKCITIGMKEILSARKIRFYLNRTWQKGIVRKILHGEVTAKVPASFFQEHKDAKLTIASYVAEQPLGQLH